MGKIAVTVHHTLPIPEAKSRVETLVDQIVELHGMRVVTRYWSGDVLQLRLEAAHQHIDGQITVEDDAVCIEIALPWILALWKTRVQNAIEQESRRLLAG